MVLILFESVLSGGHYVRSFLGLQVIKEALLSLKWQAFWQTRSSDEKKIMKEKLQVFRMALNSRREDICKSTFKEEERGVDDLMTEMNNFGKSCSEKSETCRYVMQGLELINLVELLIAADRDGNWELHVSVAERLLPIFLEFDRINYLRHASWYVEKIKNLEHENSYLFEKFKNGHFVIKDKNGRFNSVSPDLKLEQTIQRASKCPGGILGEQRRLHYVAEWDLIFHECNMIEEVLQIAIGSGIQDSRETYIHHELIGTSKSKTFNTMVNKVLNILLPHGNMFLLNDSPCLRNLLTQQSYQNETSTRMLNCFEDGIERYKLFRNERFVDKIKKLSHVIHKVKLPLLFHDDKKNVIAAKQHEANDAKENAVFQRQFDIAKAKGENIEDILKYDLADSNMLFDGEIMAKAEKSKIVNEIEDFLVKSDIVTDVFNNGSIEKTCVIVDFMSVIRSNHNQSSAKNFKELLDSVVLMAEKVVPSTMIQFVFDSYIDLTIKDSERIRRGTSVTYEIMELNPMTLLPKLMNSFWESDANKERLISCAYEYFLRHQIKETHTIVCSGYIHSSLNIIDAASSQSLFDVTELSEFPQETEADMRIILHTYWALLKGFDSLVVLTNDTDILVLLLRYMSLFVNMKLNSLYMQLGMGKHTRYFPMHKLFEALGETRCRNLIKAHIATGCDWISKVGSKTKAMVKLDLLNEFGEADLTEESFIAAEEYLVSVLKGKNTIYKTFDEYRYFQHVRNRTPIHSLVPSSKCIRNGHITRMYYLIRRLSSLLDKHFTSPDPTLYGWKEKNGYLLPRKYLNKMPNSLIRTCNCKDCSSKNCSCYRTISSCTIYCRCGGLTLCQNIQN